MRQYQETREKLNHWDAAYHRRRQCITSVNPYVNNSKNSFPAVFSSSEKPWSTIWRLWQWINLVKNVMCRFNARISSNEMNLIRESRSMKIETRTKKILNNKALHQFGGNLYHIWKYPKILSLCSLGSKFCLDSALNAKDKSRNDYRTPRWCHQTGFSSSHQKENEQTQKVAPNLNMNRADMN